MMNGRIGPFLKQLLRMLARASGVLLLFAMASCKKTPPPAPVVLTPLQILVNSDSTLSYYHRLIILSNETGLLADDSVTLLIPTNSALRGAGYTQTFIDSLQTSVADNLVRYLFIPSRTNVPGHDSASYTAFTTLSGFSIYGMPDAQGVLFNAVQAVPDTARSGKAQVYRLGALPSTPADSLPALLASDSTLSFLAEAFRRTNLYDSLLLTGNYTLLAPVNSAFINAGYDSIGAIDSADLNSLFKLLEYHTATGLYFTNTLVATPSLATVQGETITVTVVNGGIQFLGTNNPTPALLLQGDQMAGSKIVVQRISQLLSP